MKTVTDSIGTTLRKKQDLFLEESQKMIDKGKHLISKQTNLSSKFVSANSMYYIGPLIECINSKVLAAFVYGIEHSEDERTVRLCFEGIHSALQLCCHFGLENERKAFFEVLAKLSNLEYIQQPPTGQPH